VELPGHRQAGTPPIPPERDGARSGQKERANWKRGLQKMIDVAKQIVIIST